MHTLFFIEFESCAAEVERFLAFGVPEDAFVHLCGLRSEEEEEEEEEEEDGTCPASPTRA
jgi:hypothetical protein